MSTLATLTALGGAALCYGQFLRSQFWTKDIRAAYIETMLDRTLGDAVRIPFYRERFGGHVPEKLDQAPILVRGDLPHLNHQVRRMHPGGRFQAARSSGSTGMPVEVLFDTPHQVRRFAARARYLRANGWNPVKRSVWIISLPRSTPDAHIIRAFRSTGVAFVSVFTPLEEQLEWLRRFRPEYLYTYPSNLGGLLDLLENEGGDGLRLKGVFCGGEVLDEVTRTRAREMLHIPIADNYGSTEAFIAWQCPSGSYHVNSEHVHVEVVDQDGQQVRAGEVGRVLITTLNNRLMPLVRYEVGDYADVTEECCPCGRTLPLLGHVLGRSINLFHLPSGRIINPWELVVRIKFMPELKQFQIVQKSLDRCVLRYVSNTGLLSARNRWSIEREFVNVLGTDVQVDFEPVERIERAASGKFMTAYSELGNCRPQQMTAIPPLSASRTRNERTAH